MKSVASRVVAAVGFLVSLSVSFAAHGALTVEPLTWNIVGLDSNDPLAGPNRFPIGARVCSDLATTNVSVNFVWDTANANVDLRTGSLSTINIPSIGSGSCADAYFEVEVNKVPAAFDTKRRYHITATDGSGTFSTPTPREVYVEHLVSQSRNSISDVKYGTTLLNLVSVAAGGSMNLVVGETYLIQLHGGTATQGYNQFEAFINFPNTVFQILDVETTYSADDSPYVDNPSDKLYADACLWENDPNSPSYRSCIGGDFKAGGSTVVTTYTIKIISGGGTSESLNTLLYDFSGSSYHYNADYGTGARIANVIDPTTATISKSFSPNPTTLNGVSALTFTLTNPNAGTLGGYNFVDNLPANLVVANPPAATTSGCGTPTLTANAGASTISFSNGTLAANSNCVIKVNVTPTATGVLTNTTNNLFVGTTDTGDNATAPLTVNNDPPAGTGLCGLTLAAWTVPNGTVANPPDLAGGLPTTIGANVATATLAAFLPASTAVIATSGHIDTTSWRTNGYKDAGQYIEFTIDTTNYTQVQMNFWVANPSPANGPTSVNLTINNGGGFGAPIPLVTPGVAFSNYNIDATGLTNPSGNTIFRITATGAANNATGASLNYDDMTFTGCAAAIKPTMAKSFSPDPIAVNGVSTLTFALTNTNAAALTGAAFTDSLPTGVEVAATPSAATTCGGTWAPSAGNTSLTFSGGTIPASGSCTVSVNVTATTSGPHGNVSGFLSTTESGTTTTSVATDTLTAVLPPVIAKQFSPDPILAGAVSTLTFTITNPNQNDVLSGVAFTDTLPVAPGAMTVASVPNATTSGCGSPAFTPAAGAGSFAFTGGTIAGGGTCVVTVDITAPVIGLYNNTSGNVSHVINAQTVNGNTASGSLEVVPPSPSIGLFKQVGLSASGPWATFLALSTEPVFYRFTVENTGDVPLSPISITDGTVNVSTCNATFAAITLPVAVAANDNHIITCIVGPVSTTTGTVTNTAFATGTYSGTPYNSDNSSATYATTGLTLDKTSVQSTYTLAGDAINYNYLVTNSGFAPLQGPVTVSDDKATVTCPAVTTVGDLDNFLDPGESVTCTATYIITAGDVAAAFVTNTATATVDGVNSPSDSTTVFLSTSADVSVVKTLTTAGPYIAGQSITYSLFVANAGPSTATNIQLTDTPTNLTITLVSGGGCVALPCTIPSLASGANTTVTVTATITAPGAFDNTATVDADQPDPNLTNNTDNTGNNGVTGASADVSVVKTLVTAGPYTINQIITYTLFVANAGPSTATNLNVTDTPSNLSITNVTGGGCAALPCVIPSMASGANATITVTATITAAGAFDNSATVTATETDPNLSNNTDNTGNGGTASPSADVSVVKTLTTAGPYTDGQTITYTLFVANAGPSTATNVQVTDTPSNLVITNVSGGGCAALPCTIANLTSGANVTITVTATISAPGAFNNTATVTATEPDPNVSNNTDNTGNDGNAAASADVSVVKTLTTAGPYSAGMTITYTLFVANAGPSTANNVQISDTPSNLSITNVSGGGCAALPCTIPSLASGADATISVTATIIAAGAFDNSVTVSANEPDPDTSDNTDDTGNGGNADPSADVSVVKTLTTSGPFLAGQSISYTLFVANGGPSTATNVQVTDAPTNLTITNVSGGSCAALPCTIASLASGADVTITVTATIIAAGSFDNTTSVTATEFDPDSSNNDDYVGNGSEAGPAADVSVVKTLITTGPFTPGQSVTYTLFVANAGPSTATNVQVVDTPTNLTITNVSGGGCAALPCTIASLASGANATITVTATIDAAGAFGNSATVAADEPDPDSSDNMDDTTGIAGPTADISVVKTLTTAGPYSPNQIITYTLFVANAGPSTATNVQVTDTPSNLTITNVSGGGCAALPCTIPSLASGANVTITVTASINAAGPFDNTASVTATEPDPDPIDNTDSTDNGGTATSADLSLVKIVDDATPNVGGNVVFTITVTNGGPNTATNVTVTDQLPAGLTYVSDNGGGSYVPGTGVWTIASIANGASASLQITATVTASGSITNTAQVTASDQSDPNSTPGNGVPTEDDQDSAAIGATAADLSLVKIVSNATPAINTNVVFTITVTNGGPDGATGVVVEDPLPAGLTYVSDNGGGAYVPGTGVWTVGAIANGASASLQITATVTTFASVTNVAEVTFSDQVDPDSTPDNSAPAEDDYDSAAVDVPGADLSLAKTVNTTSPPLNSNITYTLTLTNAGPDTATNVTVFDQLPAGLTFVSSSTVTGSYSNVTYLWSIPSLGVGQTATLQIVATVTSTSPIVNTAQVQSADQGDPDSVPGNGNSSEDDQSNAPIVVADDPSAIPTASELGLLFCALMLAMVGVVVLKRVS